MLVNSPQIDISNVIVAHLNHDFRGQEAEDDAQFVKDMAVEWNLQYRIGRADPLTYQNQKKISSFEQAARELRYVFLRDVARDIGACAVLLGHTLDDLAETVLGHIIRGTGLQGLVGMSVSSKWPFPYDEECIQVVRPMLDISKTETESYCIGLNIPFRRDSGNYSHRFTRNRLRHSLIPELETSFNPGIKKALIRLSKIIGENLEFIDETVEHYWESMCTVGEQSSSVRINIDEYFEVPSNIKSLLLRKAYEQIIGNTTRLQENHIDQVVNQLIHGQTKPKRYQIANWPNGIKVFRDLKYLEISSKAPEEAFIEVAPIPVDLTLLDTVSEYTCLNITYKFEIMDYIQHKVDLLETGSVYLDVDVIPNRLLIRTLHQRDKFHPYGFGHTVPLSEYFAKRKINKFDRQVFPIIVDETGTVWVVDDRISELAKVTSSTKQLLRISKV